MALRSAAEPLGLCEEDSSRGGALPAEEEVSNESRQVVICQQSLVKCQLSLSKLDIRRAPPNWLQSEPFQLKAQGKQPGWTKLWYRSSSLANEQLRQDCFSVMTLLEYAFAPNDVNCGPDFIGAAKCLKQLFSIPYTEKEVSLLIHRVGKTMLICSMNPSEYRQVERFIQNGQQTLISLESPSSDKAIAPELPKNAKSAKGEGASSAETTPTKKKNKHRLNQKDLESKFLYYSAAEASTKHGPAREQDNPQWNGGFRRTLRWSFQDMCLLVGSNLLLCEDESINETEFSVRLHDAEQALSSSQCLEYYLDNRLAGVDTLALCLHSGGLVAEYRLIKTDDIPLLAEQQSCATDGFHKKRSFSQVEEKAAKLLKFLGDRCDPERCYWLFKDYGNNSFVRLLELTLHTNENRWVYNMAMLCYRVAQQHSASTTREDICRQRELLLKSLELLDGVANSNGPPRFVLRAALHEQIANNYFKAIGSLGKEESQQKEAIRCINFALAHWQNVGTFLREEKRRESETADPLDSIIEEFFFRMEKQVLACNTQLCIKRGNLGQYRQAAETLIQGMSRALRSTHAPDLRLSVQVLGDTLLQLSKKVASRDVVVSSSISEFFSTFDSLKELLEKAGFSFPPPAGIARKEGGDGEDLVIAQRLCASALQLYEASTERSSSRDLRTDYKIGNAWNELGKFQLSSGDYALAKASYETGLQTFQRHGDCLNAVACLCNLNHLERTLGFSTTKGSYEGLDTFQPFDRAIQHIELALSFIAGLESNGTGDKHIVKVWKQRVNMELAMTRLIKGCRLHEACRDLAETDWKLVETLHRTLASELHGALAIYEFYADKNEQSRKQAAAVNFHLGKHYSWCAKHLRLENFQKIMKTSKKRTRGLAERHLKLALAGFAVDSQEHKQCLLLLQSADQDD